MPLQRKACQTGACEFSRRHRTTPEKPALRGKQQSSSSACNSCSIFRSRLLMFILNVHVEASRLPGISRQGQV